MPEIVAHGGYYWLLFIRHFECQINLRKDCDTSVPKPLLMSVTDQRADQREGIFRRPNGPYRSIQVDRSIWYGRQSAGIVVHLIVRFCTKRGDHCLIVLVRRIPAARQ